jgi:hypothetical protein
VNNSPPLPRPPRRPQRRATQRLRTTTTSAGGPAGRSRGFPGGNVIPAQSVFNVSSSLSSWVWFLVVHSFFRGNSVTLAQAALTPPRSLLITFFALHFNPLTPTRRRTRQTRALAGVLVTPFRGRPPGSRRSSLLAGRAGPAERPVPHFFSVTFPTSARRASPGGPAAWRPRLAGCSTPPATSAVPWPLRLFVTA